MTTDEQVLRLADPDAGADLARFAAAAVRLDQAAVLRLKGRSDGRVGVWAQTGFDVLATRSAQGEVRPADIVVDAGELATGLRVGAESVPLGWGFDSVWKGLLPPEGGFTQVDDVPVRVLVDLAQRGMALVEENSGPQGPPPSLLDSAVLTASTADGGTPVQVPLRCVFALTAMGFVRSRTGRSITAATALTSIRDEELVRVRAHTAWSRIDTRFGSVYWRPAEQRLTLSV